MSTGTAAAKKRAVIDRAYSKSSGRAGLDILRDPAEARYESGTETPKTAGGAGFGPDESARIVEWKGGDIAAERVPLSVLIEVLLNVGEIESCHGCAVRLEVSGDGTNRLRTAEIADNGHDKIPRFEILQKPVILLGREIAALDTVLVGGRHEVVIRRRWPYVKTRSIKRPVDRGDTFDILPRERESVRFR